VRSRFCSSLVAVLLIFSIGGHWALLQSVAWVSMVVNFSKEAPLEVAVSKTFDGKHLCNLCKLVKKGKESERKRDAIKVKSQVDYWLCAQEAIVSLPDDAADFGFSSESVLRSWLDGPPSPPPRVA
jgi:hypothetical protein